MFYQRQPDKAVYFRMYRKPWNAIGTHLHGFFELHCCTGGQLRITVDDREYVLTAGEAVLVFPYQRHSFPKREGQGYFFTFAPELIGTFAARFSNYLPQQNRFCFSYDFSSLSEESDVYAIKAFLYAMCSRASLLAFAPVPVEGRALLEKIFLLTEEHFTEADFSLAKLATLLDYDYSYISKFFLTKTGMRYSFYLNQRRTDYGAWLLRTGKLDNIADASFACGYSSIRSFNRNFKRIENCTPKGCVASAAAAEKRKGPKV